MCLPPVDESQLIHDAREQSELCLVYDFRTYVEKTWIYVTLIRKIWNQMNIYKTYFRDIGR